MLANGRVYQVTKTGVLVCVEAKTGKLIFSQKPNNEQVLAVVLRGQVVHGFPNGRFLVVKPNDDGVEVLSETELEGGILGSPVAWNGKVYIHTMSKLYVFGKASGEQPKATLPAALAKPADSKAVALQVPGDILLKPGEKLDLTMNTIDQFGNVVSPELKRI